MPLMYHVVFAFAKIMIVAGILLGAGLVLSVVGEAVRRRDFSLLRAERRMYDRGREGRSHAV